MKVLIIGGTGIISTPISRALAAQGCDVLLYNRGSHPIEGTRQITGDRFDRAAFAQQMDDVLAREGRFDCVIDMILFHPDDLPDVIRAFGGRVGQYIFCSTVDVYTKTRSGYPIGEDFARDPNPAFEYAYNKALLEKGLEDAARQGAFPLTIFRPAATYNDASAPIAALGPGLALLRRMRQGKPVIVLGDGNGIWASTYCDDVAAAFTAAAGNPAAFGRAYNVTGEEWMTWKTYYRAAAAALGAPEPEFVPIPAGLLARITRGAANWSDWNFQYNNIFDNALARADLGYRYTLPWAEGAARMAAYHDRLGAIDAAPPFPLYDRVVEAWKEHARRLEQALE